MRAQIIAILATTLALSGCDQIQRMAQQRREAASQGGAYLVLEVDSAYILEEELEVLQEEMAATLRSASPPIPINGRGVLEGAARVRLVDAADMPRAVEALSHIRAGRLIVSQGEQMLVETRLPADLLERFVTTARDRSLFILKRRFDFPDIAVEPVSTRGILIHAGPRFSDPTLLQHGLVMSKFAFHLVRELDPDVAGRGAPPPGVMLAQPYPGFGRQVEFVEQRPRLTGANLVSASTTADPRTGDWVIAFRLDEPGTRTFCRLTRENLGRRFAILLDGQVLTAPTINEEICGGSGQISGAMSVSEAREMADLLNSGPLPAPLIVLEQGVGNYHP